jgi:O-antigen/teichoic acid export membrane protein
MNSIEPAAAESLPGRREAPSRIAHNTVLNLLGLGIPLLVAFFVMPVALHALGPMRFGLLGLAWAATEYLGLFDLGMGRATVRFVAEAHVHGNREIGRIASTSVVTQTATGVAGAIVFALAVPLVVNHIFSVPIAERPEAITMFRVVALNLPVVLLLSTLRGVLEGVQRFDMSNSIKVATSAAAVIIPAIAAKAGIGLAMIMFFLLFSRLAGCIALEYAIRRAIPGFRWERPQEWLRLKKMLFFGGWVSVSSVISPILVYLDRFSLAALVGLSAVGYYTAPYEGVSRLLLIPISLVGTLFPALTTEEARGNRARAGTLMAGSVRHLMLAMASPVAILIALSPLLLRMWLGEAAAANSGTALRILAAGVFMNALAHPPYVYLYSLGRPDLPAKFHLGELCVHVPLTWFLVSTFGVAGAATAWSIRVTIDWALLTIFARRYTKTAGALPSARNRIVVSLTAALFALALPAGLLAATAPLLAVAAVGCSILAYIAIAWWWALDDSERLLARSMGQWYLTGFGRRASG